MPAASDIPEPVRLRPGLTVVGLRTSITEPVVTTDPEHRVFVNVGRPYRLVESLGDASRPTPGTPGDVAVVPAGIPLAARSLDGTPQPLDSLLVVLSPALVAEVLEAAGGAPRPRELAPVAGARSPAVAQLGALLHTGLADRSGLGRLALESLGSALAVAVVRDHATARTPLAPPTPRRELAPAQLHAVLRLVEDDLSAPLTVADLAARAHVSAFHFSRLFRGSTGLSPYQYLLQRRLAHARELLTATELPVAQIAVRCGFADQSHLTRLARRHLGSTPAALRSAARGR
jgi:AraC family transcriptional regulator